MQFYTKELTNHFSEDSTCKWHNYSHLLDHLNAVVDYNPFDTRENSSSSSSSSCSNFSSSNSSSSSSSSGGGVGGDDSSTKTEETFCDSCEMMTLLIEMVRKAIEDMEFCQTPPGFVNPLSGREPIIFDAENKDKLQQSLNEIKTKFETFWAHKVCIL